MLTLMGETFRTTWVAAVAGQLHRFTRIVTVLAAILVVARSDAVAGWMGALFGFSHNPVTDLSINRRLRVEIVSSARSRTTF
jgi:hypothetical protein